MKRTLGTKTEGEATLLIGEEYAAYSNRDDPDDKDHIIVSFATDVIAIQHKKVIRELSYHDMAAIVAGVEVDDGMIEPLLGSPTEKPLKIDTPIEVNVIDITQTAKELSDAVKKELISHIPE